MSDYLDQEILRRRTFAIISHPDVGKTTLMAVDAAFQSLGNRVIVLAMG